MNSSPFAFKESIVHTYAYIHNGNGAPSKYNKTPSKSKGNKADCKKTLYIFGYIFEYSQWWAQYSAATHSHTQQTQKRTKCNTLKRAGGFTWRKQTASRMWWVHVFCFSKPTSLVFFNMRLSLYVDKQLKRIIKREKTPNTTQRQKEDQRRREARTKKKKRIHTQRQRCVNLYVIFWGDNCRTDIKNRLICGFSGTVDAGDHDDQDK